MLLLRSGQVEDPGVWGVPGGAVKGTEGMHDSDNAARAGESWSREQLWHTAMEETHEEIGMFPSKFTVHPDTVVFDTNPANPNSFKYHTFIVEIPMLEKSKMFKAHSLNWENDEMQWYPIATLMSRMSPEEDNPHPAFEAGNMHRGVAHVLDSHSTFTSPDQNSSL